nr:hypothetical protein CFP56_29393 [Quercus suber]
MSKRTSQANMKRKGKAPAVQPKQFRKPSVRISDKHEGVSIETISLQNMLLAEAMYSCGEKSEILQEVLRIDLIFRDGVFTDLPLHIKLVLDNLQAASTLKQKPLFQKTLKALELYLVNTSAFIEASSCQLLGKEDGD